MPKLSETLKTDLAQAKHNYLNGKPDLGYEETLLIMAASLIEVFQELKNLHSTIESTMRPSTPLKDIKTKPTNIKLDKE